MTSQLSPRPAKKALASPRADGFSHDPVPQVETAHRRATIDFSKALGVRTIIIQSHHVQMLFEHHFERVDHALYIATKAARNQHRIKEARIAETEIHRLLDEYSQSLATNLSSLKKQLESSVPQEFQTLLYDHKREFEAPIRTGYSQRLLVLTAQLDQLIGIIENLELNNVLTPENSDKSIKSWIHYYRQLCSSIQKVRKNSLGGTSSGSSATENPANAESPAPSPEIPPSEPL